MKPSYFPNQQDSLMFFRGNHNKTYHSHECFHFLKENELQYPNVHGLVICELLDRELNFLKSGDVLIGYDYLHHLTIVPKFGHAVPYLMKDGEDEYSHNWFPWTGYLDHDELLLGYRKA